MSKNKNKTGAVETVVTGTFESQVLSAKGAVLVAFWAPWSKPCLVLDATLDEVVATCAEDLKVVRVNADDNPDLSLCYDVQFIPTLLFFVDGKLSARLVGTCSKEAIISKMQEASPRSERLTPSHEGARKSIESKPERN